MSKRIKRSFKAIGLIILLSILGGAIIEFLNPGWIEAHSRVRILRVSGGIIILSPDTGVKISDDRDGAITFLGQSAGSDEDLTINLDDVANEWTFSTSTGVTLMDLDGSLDLEVSGSDVTIGEAGVKLTGDTDGALTFLGLGNGTDEDLTLNLDDVANTVGVSSSTGVTSLDMQEIAIVNNENSVTVDGATTFAITSPFVTLACTGAETINTITGGITTMILTIRHTDTDCTIADDDAATAANAVDLEGTATNLVGAAKLMLQLYYNGTDWEQVSKSDN